MFGQNADVRKLGPQAGIAIGPILFIIAILAILAAAIAAGSGSFTAGTGSESNRTKSSALVQIGENLRIGMDRITMEAGLDPLNIDINVSNTSAGNALFSPIGGGISPPSVGMAANPAVDKWFFVEGTLQGLGTGGSNRDVVAVLPITAGVCSEVNNRSVGVAKVETGAGYGNFVSGTLAGSTGWPTSPPLVGVATGCIQNTDVSVSSSGPSSNYFFYQVLAVQ